MLQLHAVEIMETQLQIVNFGRGLNYFLESYLLGLGEINL